MKQPNPEAHLRRGFLVKPIPVSEEDERTIEALARKHQRPRRSRLIARDHEELRHALLRLMPEVEDGR